MIENIWEGASFAILGQIIIKDLDWRIAPDENIVITGPVGSGKTSLIKSLARSTHLTDGRRKTIIDGLESTYRTFYDQVKAVYFSESSNLFRTADFFYQQRYQASIASSGTTVEQYLANLPLSPTESLPAWIEFSGIDQWKSLHLIQLSSGQRRKLMLTKALMQSPRWLLLDDPYVGMDKESRSQWNKAVLPWCTKNKIQWVITGRKEDIPITGVTWIDLENFKTDAFLSRPKEILTRAPSNTFISPESPEIDIFNLEDIFIQYGDKVLMDGLSATMKRGEKVCLKGKNGSGKSTLLSLLFGDNPLAYREKIHLFGRRRGSGETIWDIKKKIGYVSPESHLYFPMHLSVKEVIAGGYEDKIEPSLSLNPDQIDTIRTWLSATDLLHFENTKLGSLSTGEQKIVLWIRALIKSPELMLLDEPYQGLDRTTIKRLNKLLDNWIHPNQSLLFITHYDYEVPSCITSQWVLENGQINISPLSV